MTLQDKIDKSQDDIIVSYVCQLRVFKAAIWMTICVAILLSTSVFVLYTMVGYTAYGLISMRVSVLEYAVGLMVGFMLFYFAICVGCSKKLS